MSSGRFGRGLLCAISWYQTAVSPAFAPRCRFHPSCSAYAAEAIAVHGSARGLGLSAVRIVKCAPWHPGGVDLVPEPRPRPAPSAEHDRPARATSPALPRPDAQEETSVA